MFVSAKFINFEAKKRRFENINGHFLYKVSLQKIFYTPLHNKAGAALVRTITSLYANYKLLFFLLSLNYFFNAHNDRNEPRHGNQPLPIVMVVSST